MERFHQSQAKVLVTECAAVLRYQMDHERASTKAMDLGSLLDCLVFDRRDRYRVVEVDWGVYASGPRKGQPREPSWANEAASTVAADLETKGVLPVLQKDVDALQDQADRARQRLGDMLGGRKRDTLPRVQWVSALGVECEGEPDLIWSDAVRMGTIDLKRTTALNPRAMQRQIAAMGWDIQGAAYREAALSLYPDHKYEGHTLLACQSGGAQLIETYTLDESYMVIGQTRWEQGQRIWQDCWRTGTWPGYTAFGTEIGPTRWLVHETLGMDEADDDLSGLGLERQT